MFYVSVRYLGLAMCGIVIGTWFNYIILFISLPQIITKATNFNFMATKGEQKDENFLFLPIILN